MQPSSDKLWSILIATVPQRSKHLERLLLKLLPQVEPHRVIEVIINSDNGKKSVGKKRQELLEWSTGKYVSFIDDDDLVADNYVEAIMPHLEAGVDTVPLMVALYRGRKVVSLTRRRFCHLNPIKREIAIQAKFSGGFGEDERWWQAIMALDAVKTTGEIEETMYHYHFNPEESLFRGNTA